ncbi:MAG: F0F1 ATP synthase subunit [Alphaproteobacteria bacterium]|nr:F0F1 ATP synthase subunit [Alphaproteobacteria bacterium]
MDEFTDQIKAQTKRKLRAKSRENHIWSGFGMFGLVGWSVALPAVLGALLGIWIDERYPNSHSWTLVLLIAGLCIGCWNAARWVMKEHKSISDEESKND